MKNWFGSFESALRNDEVTEDLVGAGKASAELAMAHYRFQHQAKIREAIEDTFPVLLKFLGEEWDHIWKTFWEQNEVSPRSLDFFPEVFVNHYVRSGAPLHLKELARFEHDLDIYPWTHGRLDPVQTSTISGDSRLEIGPHEIRNYEARVSSLYDEEEEDYSGKQRILLWMKGDSVHYRGMADWELKVLSALSEGVEKALEYASDDGEEVSRFFSWLGSSHLIRNVP